ncbi:MAG: Gfo/Idh/MocA family oxidoreductase [Verrucomicrobia bacterium]|nr:Gfo/Idh/MocA family oxidoreductase [Verrucomicrobiota bacterium]MCH8510605.1 Gfo/Idh/MocA family oxidoreductase [Kiritimatiellia bacterium]
MSTTPILRLGGLGLGEGRSVISAALSAPEWEIGMICDLDEGLCRERCREFGEMPWTRNYAEMLGRDDIDVIAIYTPDPLHAPHMLQALEAGKHVICTKPLLDDLTPGPALLQAQRASGKRVMVGQSTRFVESMMRQRADFEAGRFGKLVSVEAKYIHDHRNYMNGKWGPELTKTMNWVYLGLSHPVDLVRWYLPEIEEVFAYGLLSPFAAKAGLQKADSLHAVLKSADGVIAQVTGIYGVPEHHPDRDALKTCTLRGTCGTSTSDYPQLRYSRNLDGHQPEWIAFPELNDYYYRFGGYMHHAGEFENYLRHFAQALARGESPQPDLEDGLRTVAVMKALERSVESGTPVRVAEILREYNVFCTYPTNDFTLDP